MPFEFTILSALKSKIFKKIFVIFDNTKYKDFFEKKYNISGIIHNKRNVDFVKLVKKYINKYFNSFNDLCVYFPMHL